jgi:putative DNA primase/helicase
MVKVASVLQSGFVVADNDASLTGEKTAKQIGWPYWISDTVGEDANDTHQRLGLFKFSQALVKSMSGL